MNETNTAYRGLEKGKYKNLDAEHLHLVCRLQWNRLRAWKKRSIRAGVTIDGRIRPQAYSSSSSGFRSFLDNWHNNSTKPAYLWIVTSYRIPGRRHLVPSLAAKIQVKSTYRGNDKRLTEDLRRYVVRWTDSIKEKQPQLCRVVEAEPTFSRFYPANDMTDCLKYLQYVNRDGTPTEYSPRRALRVRPQDTCLLEKFAETIAQQTVFISYKHNDFIDKSAGSSPPWTVKKLAGTLIANKFGVWLDALCSPPKSEESSQDLSPLDVRLLLKEGHAQSSVVIGIETEKYLTPGEGDQNWTLDEYVGTVSGKLRNGPLLRFALHGGAGSKLEPRPVCAVSWSENLHTIIVSYLTPLIKSGVPC